MNFTLFISYAHEDGFIAKKLKNWLEEIFLNADVFMSGIDIRGGSVWSKEILDKLKESKAIIVLLTKKSWDKNWVYFEAGAGFTEEKTIPICCDGYSVGDLKTPLSIFQARNLNKKGLNELTKDIAKLSDTRPPSVVSTDVINEIESFLQERNMTSWF